MQVPATSALYTRLVMHHTPVLYNLHWLPVPYRIQFKILLLVHLKKGEWFLQFKI